MSTTFRNILVISAVAILVAGAVIITVEQFGNEQNQSDTPSESNRLTPPIPEDLPATFRTAEQRELAEGMLESARLERASAETALKSVQQRIQELESQLQTLEANGVDLSVHEAETEAVFEQLLADFEVARQRLDNAIIAEHASLMEVEALDR